MSAMDELKKEYREVVAELQEQRDELKVKIHLASMEAKEEWEKLEHNWDKLTLKAEKIKEELGHSGGEVGDAFAVLADELKKGYQRLKRLF